MQYPLPGTTSEQQETIASYSTDALVVIGDAQSMPEIADGKTMWVWANEDTSDAFLNQTPHACTPRCAGDLTPACAGSLLPLR